MKNPKSIIITAALLILVGGGSFYAGMEYQQSKGSRFGNFQGNRNGQFQQRMGFRPVNGEIISVDDKSITVKLTDNSSKIILLTDFTAINKSTEGSKDDLKVGEMIAAFGTENSDRSITAQNIQLNPTFRGLPGGGTPRN